MALRRGFSPEIRTPPRCTSIVENKYFERSRHTFMCLVHVDQVKIRVGEFSRIAKGGSEEPNLFTVVGDAQTVVVS